MGARQAVSPPALQDAGDRPVTAQLFLTAEELAELTGYTATAHQRKWLDANGYRYALNANNRPIVARDYLLSRLGVTVAAAAETASAAAPRPNFSALANSR